MTATASTVRLDGSLPWEPFDIPGGSEPVAIARLNAEPTRRAITLLVRFPAGWMRHEDGWYVSAEDAVMLEGSLELSGHTLRARDWFHIPARTVRTGMRSPDGCLVVARFGGPAKWIADLTGDGPPMRVASLDAPGKHQPSPLGPARLLRAGEPDSAWVVEPLDGLAPCDVEVLDGMAYAFVPAGEALPSTAGPSFCRTFAPDA